MASTEHTTDTPLPTVRRLIDQGIAQGLHIGAQVYAALNGKTVANLAIGERRPGLPLTNDTLMLWLSASKPVTAIAIAQQLEQGRLNLDDPVASHLPDFAQHGKGDITLRHLLTHTAGLRAAPYRFPEDDWDTIIRKICAARPEPRWTPGERAGYHISTSWFILGEVLQRTSGEHFSDYVRRHIFETLGMRDCWLGIPPAQYDAYGDRIAYMMDTAKHPPRPNHWHERPRATRPVPGANAYGPIHELGRLYRALLNGGELDGQRILHADTVELFTRRQRQGMHDETFKAPVDWGLGFIVDSKRYGEPVPYGFGPHASEQTFGHGGSQSSIGFADPAHDLAAAIVFNGMPGEAKHQQRMNATLAALYEDLGLG